MPDMGESVTEGTVLEWHVSVGDWVDEGQTLVEVSTDKVDAEVPATVAGTVTGLLVEPDEDVAVGAPLAVIETGSEPPAPSDGGHGAAPSAERSSSENTTSRCSAEAPCGPACSRFATSRPRDG